MNEQQLLQALRDRAANPAIRTDYAERRSRELGVPASSNAVVEAERAMGCALHPLHRSVFQEVANGGFGPGDGLVGLPGGSLDVDGRSIVDLKKALWLDDSKPLPAPVVPLCEWGDGIWSCIDSKTGAVLTLGESDLMVIGTTFHRWLEDWATGINLWGGTVTFESSAIDDPFTKKAKVVQVVSGLKGKPYASTHSATSHPSATFSTSLPKFSPLNSFSSVSGKFSRPSTMSSRDFSLPAAIQPAMSWTACGYRDA
jgi:hypothetical protein